MRLSVWGHSLTCVLLVTSNNDDDNNDAESMRSEAIRRLHSPENQDKTRKEEIKAQVSKTGRQDVN